MNLETRCSCQPISVDKRTLHGYAIVFDALSEDLGGFRERIHRSAVDASLRRRPDVMALAVHNHSHVLGRTASKTLRLRSDSYGLAVEVDLPDTTYARDLIEQIRRGDVLGMSFGFFDLRSEWTRVDGYDVRDVYDFDLLEVSVTSSPAYPDTSVGLKRSRRGRGNIRHWKRYLRLLEKGIV